MTDKIACTVYVEQELYDFIGSVRWSERNSRTEQMEQMLLDWKEKWVEEHGGKKALETIRKWSKEAEERAMKRKQRREAK